MIEAARECNGACDDRRASFVDEAVGARDADRRRATILWARAALHEAGAPGAGIEEGETVAGWFCFGCRRLEAPQACLGVCIHRPSSLAPLDVRSGVARERADRRAAPARRAAWTSPRAGRR